MFSFRRGGRGKNLDLVILKKIVLLFCFQVVIKFCTLNASVFSKYYE